MYYKICSYIIKHHITKIYGGMDARRIAPSTGQRWQVSFKPSHFIPDERARSPIGQRAGWTPEPVRFLLRRRKSLAHAANRASNSRSPNRYPSNYTELSRVKKKNPLHMYWREISCKHHDRRSDVRCGKYGAVATEDTRVIVSPPPRNRISTSGIITMKTFMSNPLRIADTGSYFT